MFKQYGGFALAMRTYWEDYGGWKDLFQSPILHVSVLLSIASLFDLISIDWRTLTIGMMPTILGFSLAAYAITFSLMGSKLHTALARATDGAGKPLAISVNATFFHNVFIQALYLSFAVISKGPLFAKAIKNLSSPGDAQQIAIKVEVSAGDLFGTFLLIYAILLLFSSGLAMFRLGRLTPSTTSPLHVANDGQDIKVRPPSAHQLYGFRWKVVRAVAMFLRVKG